MIASMDSVRHLSGVGALVPVEVEILIRVLRQAVVSPSDQLGPDVLVRECPNIQGAPLSQSPIGPGFILNDNFARRPLEDLRACPVIRKRLLPQCHSDLSFIVGVELLLEASRAWSAR